MKNYTVFPVYGYAIVIKMMDFEENSIQWQNSSLQYFIAGKGRPILMFPGYGQEYEHFEPLINLLSPFYKCYFILPFFHGKSLWAKGEQPIKKEEWITMINILVDKHDLKIFSLLGYSLGGKFVLTIVELLPNRVKDIFLIAPDGVTANPWYRLATSTLIMRVLFKKVITHPAILNSVISFLNQFKLLDKKTIKFVKSQMSTDANRKKVYFSWVVFRKLFPRHDELVKILRKFSLEPYFILGKYDAVIREKDIIAFTRKLQNYQLEVLPTSHGGLIVHPGIIITILNTIHQDAK